MKTFQIWKIQIPKLPVSFFYWFVSIQIEFFYSFFWVYLYKTYILISPFETVYLFIFTFFLSSDAAEVGEIVNRVLNSKYTETENYFWCLTE